jgi:hypothetical protein
MNTAVGYEALKGSSTAANNTGTENTALGGQALLNNTTGCCNTGIGSNALKVNSTGVMNTAIGSGSQSSINANGNTSVGFASLRNGGNQNTAIGYYTLSSISNSGTFNNAIGSNSLEQNTTGSRNLAIGNNTLMYNKGNNETIAIGHYAMLNSDNRESGISTGNIAIGIKSMYGSNFDSYTNPNSPNTGTKNTAIGYETLLYFTTASNNTVLGYSAGSSITTGSNNIIIGYNSQPSTTSVTDEITFGNSSNTVIRANVSTITSLSDKRDKKNINDLNLGLNFINALKPRVFNWDKREWYKNGISDGSKISKVQTAGFIAQELDESQNKYNAEWLKLVYKSNPNKWEATYGNLLPVVVKSIQELSSEKDKEINELKERVLTLEKLVNKLIEQKH